jgi:hypothetical protein
MQPDRPTLSHLIWWRLRERFPSQQYEQFCGQQQRSAAGSAWLSAWFVSDYGSGIGQAQPYLNLPPYLVEIEGTNPSQQYTPQSATCAS